MDKFMGTKKRPQIYIGTLPSGSEYYYFLKPISTPSKKSSNASVPSSKKSATTSKKSALTKARERKVKLG